MIFRFFDRLLRPATRVLAACSLVVAASSQGSAELPTAEHLFPQLESILRDALAQSPRMVARNLERLQMQQYVLMSSSRLYPQIGGGFRVNEQQDIRSIGGNPNDTVTGEKFTYDFSINQTLFHWGQIKAESDIGKIRAAIAENNTTEAWRLLALEIRRAYLQLVGSKIALANARFDADLARKRLELARAGVATGEMASTASAGAEGVVEDADLTVERAARALDAGLMQFRRLIGRDAFDATMVPDDLPAVTAAAPGDTDVFRVNFVEKAGVEQTSRFQNAELDLEIERLGYRIARVNLRPMVDLSAGMTQDEISYTGRPSDKSGVRSMFVGLYVRWNIWDGFANRGRVRAAQTSVRLREHALAETKRDLLEAAANAAADLDLAARSLRLAEKRYAGVPGSVAALKPDFERGRIKQDALDAAQSGANAARLAIVGTRSNYLNALANFLSAVNADPFVQLAEPAQSKR